MIAGPGATTGRTFEQTVVQRQVHDEGSRHRAGADAGPVPLDDTGVLRRRAARPLPTLNLQRVDVLTGSNTCSASESIINSLRGVGVEVIVVG